MTLEDDVLLFGLRMRFAWALRKHSGQPEEAIDLSTEEARAESPGVMGLLEHASALGLGGSA